MAAGEGVPTAPLAGGPWRPEPRLVLVRGLGLGRTVGLSGGTPGEDRGWVIGNTAEADVELSWDPFVDAKNAEIVPEDRGYRILDLRSADGRVTVNDATLDRGGEARLERGDLIPLGRSALLYQGP